MQKCHNYIERFYTTFLNIPNNLCVRYHVGVGRRCTYDSNNSR